MEKSRVVGGGKSRRKVKSKQAIASVGPETNKPKPKKTEIDVNPFTIRIVNTITYNQTKLTVRNKYLQ
jgi:hypothetical protein